MKLGNDIKFDNNVYWDNYVLNQAKIFIKVVQIPTPY